MGRVQLPLLALVVGALSLSPAGATAHRPDRSPSPHSNSSSVPSLVLWAWERPTDLRGLDASVGVAFLAQTITLRQDRFDLLPRRNPLRVSPATPLTAVTRIEHPADVAPALGEEEIARLASAISRTTSWPQVVAVQIDFDAAESERPVYRALLARVRAVLGPQVPLSITALASWCVGDRWLDDLPVDEAVPMLFRMGPLNAPYVSMARVPTAGAPVCQGAVGTSLDEPLSLRASGRRVYVFNAEPWTPASMARARAVAE